MRDLEVHCPTCTCTPADGGYGDPTAPGFALVLAVQWAWTELLAEDRAAGRTWRRYSKTDAA